MQLQVNLGGFKRLTETYQKMLFSCFDDLETTVIPIPSCCKGIYILNYRRYALITLAYPIGLKIFKIFKMHVNIKL